MTVNSSSKFEESYCEKELCMRISNGDEIAFRKLFFMYKPLFSSIAYSVTNDSAVSSDILQETFLRIWLNRDVLKNVDNIRSWSLRILYRLSFNWIRHQKVKSKSDYKVRQFAESSSNQVEDVIYFNETKTLLQRAVNKLPPQTQKIYRLNKEQDYKISEIAEQLELSSQTIKNVLGKALKSIRKFLLQEGIQN